MIEMKHRFLGGVLIGAAALAVVTFGVKTDSNEPIVSSAQALAEQVAVVGTAQAQAVRIVPQTMPSYAGVVEKVLPAVVNIYTRSVQRTRMTDFFGFPLPDRMREQSSLGSGVIVRSNGLIVTNNHVIAGAQEIKVVLSDRREFAGKVVLADPRTDLALVQVETAGKPLPTARLGDSDNLRVGDIVFAIGNPLGAGQTVTHGIVSALARTNVGVSDFQSFIQTDAPINPGNSGGALVGMNGDLIGINTAIWSQSGGSQGIGFAVPVSMVRSVIGGVGQGKVVRPWLGVSAQPIDSDLARSLKLDRPVGVLVNRITAGSPAARAGVQSGDVIFAVDGKEVNDEDGLRFRVGTKTPGQTAILTLIRNGKAQNITVTLQAPSETPLRSLTVLRGNHIFNGVQVGNLSPAFVQELGAALPERGVVVTDLVQGSVAARLGMLQPGDVIESVNGQTIGTIPDLQTQLARSASGMTFRVSRQGSKLECTVRPPAFFNCRQ
jgi:Do/DeqQ family serine protease